ncbi:MAG: translocation/assembly module TamB domain-containing protein [Janthinobacterium lividum]
MSGGIRWARRIAGILAALVGLVALAAGLVDTTPGHRLVADAIGRIRTDNGLRFSVGRIDGSIYSAATLDDVRVYDPHGLVAVVPVARLDWRPLRWFRHRLEIRSLVVPLARVLQPLHTRETGTGTTLPDFDILIGRLAIGRLDLAPAVTGVARSGRIAATADLHAGRALVHLDATVDGSDRIHARIDAAPARDRFDLDATLRGTADGVLARVTGLRRALVLDVAGQGSWRGWRGRALGSVGGRPLIALSLQNRSGDYRVSGVAAPSLVTSGKLATLTAPRVRVDARGTLVNRVLRGIVTLRSPALTLRGGGGIDLGTRAFRDVRLVTRLERPAALFPTMTGRAVALALRLDGAFATARFSYALAAERLAFGDTGFDLVHASGSGRWSHVPVAVPIRLTAARVTGVGDDAGGILRGFAAQGVLRLTPKLLTGEAIRVRSDKLTGTIALSVDLDGGAFRIGVNGALGRYLIPGLGIVDVTTDLRMVPGPAGHGTRVIGRGTARMIRLDNGFFRSLAGGLPTLATDLERTPDGLLHLSHLVLSGPTIRLAGTGLRRRDGSFAFAGSGTQGRLGPVTLRLDGRIEKPMLDLVFARPTAALGLAEVALHLDPDPAGFAFRAQGRSKLGPFAGTGRIALPPGQPASIEVAALTVAGIRASGAVAIADAGLDGALAIGGDGVTGRVLLRPVGAVQRIELHLDAAAATLGGGATLRRGRLDLAAMLDPAGTRVEATATGGGLRRGTLVLGRFAAHAALVGGTGEVRAELAGDRGRAFDIQTSTHVAPDRYDVAAQGTLGGRPLRLTAPAVIVAEGGGWRLQPARLAFAGGEATVAGRVADGGVSGTAALTALPLSILDLARPGLGLGGSAWGTLSIADTSGGPPTGRVSVTVRGLTRSGLASTSTPIDVGLAGVLSADRLGMRAVMAAGGRTIGRAQAMVSPAGTGDLASRLARGALVAQLRYAGPADTVWRLAGIELFDLSGPITIAADARGQLADPVIRGTVEASGARIESTRTGTVLTNVQASGRFAGSRLSIDRIAADAGKGGRVTGTGRFDFSAVRGVGIDLALRADHAALIARDDIAATVTGALAFRSTGAGGTIAGAVTLDRSRYRLGQASAAAAVPRLAVREINVPGGDDAADAGAPATPWKLDLHASAARGLLVSGLGLSSEWSADLAIGGDGANPAITGRATLVRGDVAFAGREFQLSRGVIRFTGDVPADPGLDIAADTNAGDLAATIRVTGTAAKPEIGFTSVPALPEDELLSRLLFGTSITSLTAPQALQLASAVAALQARGGRGGLDPINAVRRVAGLDRLRILPADPQTGQGTSVAAGKYVTRRLYAEIVTDGQGYSATQAEFQVTRWLSILSSVSTLGRTSGNLRVSKDY